MKTRKKPTGLTFTLLLGVSFAWNLTSCSTPQTEPAAEVKEKAPEESKPDLTGVWANEGELCGLYVLEDGTCSLREEDPVDGELKISGRWTQQGRVLTVNLNEDWRGEKMHTFYFLRKDWGDGNWQDLLMVKEGGEENFQFYRVSSKD